MGEKEWGDERVVGWGNIGCTTVEAGMSAHKPFTSDDPRHGTENGYGNLRCRCQPCRDAHTAKNKRKRAQRAQRISLDDARHGDVSFYFNHSCRCEMCRKANADYVRTLRNKNKEMG